MEIRWRVISDIARILTFMRRDEHSVLSENSVPNPGHRPGFLPNFLGDMGAEVIIAGGMGEGAVGYLTREIWK